MELRAPQVPIKVFKRPRIPDNSSLKKLFFSALRTSVWSKNKGGPLDPPLHWPRFRRGIINQYLSYLSTPSAK